MCLKATDTLPLISQPNRSAPTPNYRPSRLCSPRPSSITSQRHLISLSSPLRTKRGRHCLTWSCTYRFLCLTSGSSLTLARAVADATCDQGSQRWISPRSLVMEHQRMALGMAKLVTCSR